MACFTIVPLVYAVALGVFFFVSHVVFVTHVRGSAVRLGPEQFPTIHARVVELAARAGLSRAPDTYLMQAGGSLNALATKFLRSHMIVLFSDLLEACGDDDAARDMIIGHEIGHVRSGHLRFLWFLLPGFFVPFLGSAYSRAREYTCDRWGAALCGDRRGAVHGLTILAAGGAHSAQVNLDAFARQRRDLDTGWMTLGQWLSTYPILSKRVVAIEPQLAGGVDGAGRGPIRALGILALAGVVPIVLIGVFAAKAVPLFRQAIQEAEQTPRRATPKLSESQIASTRTVVESDFKALSEMLLAFRERHGHLPDDSDAVYDAWLIANGPKARAPRDPFDGHDYGYSRWPGGFTLYSSGPDGEIDTEDDIEQPFEYAAGKP
jgi:Zn-dependent protease with chaperone function